MQNSNPSNCLNVNSVPFTSTETEKPIYDKAIFFTTESRLQSEKLNFYMKQTTHKKTLQHGYLKTLVPFQNWRFCESQNHNFQLHNLKFIFQILIWLHLLDLKERI